MNNCVASFYWIYNFSPILCNFTGWFGSQILKNFVKWRFRRLNFILVETTDDFRYTHCSHCVYFGNILLIRKSLRHLTHIQYIAKADHPMIWLRFIQMEFKFTLQFKLSVVVLATSRNGNECWKCNITYDVNKPVSLH